MRFSNLPNYPDGLPATAGVLLKRQPLSDARYAQALVREAQRRARALIRAAEREATECHKRAARAGYEAGFLDVLHLALDYLLECKNMQLRLREKMEAEAREALLTVLDDTRLVMRLAKHLGKRRSELEMTFPRVTLPRQARSMATAVCARIEEIWPGSEVVYADTGSFIVEWSDQVLEFAPNQTASQLTATAMEACDEAVSAIDTNALIHSIFVRALTRVKGVPVAPPDNAAAST
jgi:hypothetical protein